jgi:hypothetical protein
MKHAHAGRPQTSNRGKPMKLRRRALNLIKKTQEKDIPVRRKRRFGPTLAAEHLADEDGIVVDPDVARWRLAEHLLRRRNREEALPYEGSARSTLAS